MEAHPRYQVLEKIASGSFATVYRGRDLELGRDVAIKQIHQQYLENPEQLERYWQEAQLLASFQHPNIVTIYDLVRDRGWLILELMQGNLAKVAGRKAFDLDSLRSTVAHCLRALKFLHAHGVIHGDIKPSNMMVDRRKRVKLGDFGLARRVSDEDGSLIKGTTKYMAPELVSDEFGTVSPASDLYSLGFAAYELLAGENFESLFPGLGAFGRDRQIAWMMWHAAPDRRLPEIKRVLADVPDDLAHVIQKLTAKRQSERYATADEALADLNLDIRTSRGLEDHATEPVHDADPAEGKRKTLLIVAVVGSLLMSLLMLFMPSGGPVEPLEPGGEPTARGVIRELQLANGRIVIEDTEGVPSDVEIGDRPRIRLNDDKFILPRELQPGDHVEVRREGAGNGPPTLFLSVLRPQDNRGEIKSLTANDSELMATVEVGAGHEDVSLFVPKRSKLTLNGKEVTLAELQPKDRLEVVHIKDREGRAARQVLRLEAFRLNRVVGYLSEFDPEKRRLTLARRGESAQSKVLDVAPKCAVKINGESVVDGKQLAVGDLRPGDRLEILMDVQAAEIVARRGNHLTGAIKEVAEPGRVFDVQLDASKSGELRRVNVSPQSLVTLGGEDAAAGDLRKFDRVDLLQDEAAASQVLAIDAIRPKRQDRLVILIAVQNYQDRRLTVLHTPLADAQLVQTALISRYGVAPERLVFLKDPTQSQIETTLDDWLGKATNLTQVVVYLSAHAYADDQGRIRVAPREYQSSKPEETGIPLVRFLEKMEASPAREKLLLLDTSHSGSGPDLARQPSTGEMIEVVRARNASLSLKTVSVLASCSKGETGRTLPGHHTSLFPEALASGFAGAADQNLDLDITPRELFDYLSRQMVAPPSADQPGQTPFLWQP